MVGKAPVKVQAPSNDQAAAALSSRSAAGALGALSAGYRLSSALEIIGLHDHILLSTTTIPGACQIAAII